MKNETKFWSLIKLKIKGKLRLQIKTESQNMWRYLNAYKYSWDSVILQLYLGNYVYNIGVKFKHKLCLESESFPNPSPQTDQ